ncbi:class IV adenylate cyclase [Archaeoglobus veneficus]|uniref:Adenylyl cyclase CyaB n=1 Tax=Archaeoglobus veneficus (strain DSM 11195 / SNP6) TaxID=693661 RepID=F2KMT7_ARCVS|nr:class IV adenylate cyclase [Archaeoglobus veneficus]AEA46111.1 adenylyl cyclase CyaB [Archaeoglobus veneficus SNP6]
MEVEVKFSVEGFEEVEKKLAETGKFVIEKEEEDLYFNSPWRDFRKSDEALRIRKDSEGVTLTYKGRKIDKETKTREEIKLKVEDFDNCRRILEKLGFTPVRWVKKRRRIYQVGEAVVCLDEIDGLGKFVEVEIESEDVEGAKKKVFEVARSLGLEGESIRKSYLEMLENL